MWTTQTWSDYNEVGYMCILTIGYIIYHYGEI